MKILYDKIRYEIENKTLTYTECIDIIETFLITQQITKDEYLELLELAKELLKVNTDNDELEARVKVLEEKVEKLEKGESTIEENEGTKEKPINATRGMIYFKDKYYKDSEDEKVYLCIRQDTEKGTLLNYLPHELVGNYFQLA